MSGSHTERTRHTARSGRLIVVAQSDPSRHYPWLPPSYPGDVTVVLDEEAGADLTARQPISFDQLQSWEQRSEGELRVNELLRQIGAHPAVAAIEHAGFGLYEFAEYRLRRELAMLLRGWTLARAAPGAGELICDPAVAPALAIGACAGLGLDLRAIRYTLPPALPGSARRRAVGRQGMRLLAAVSRPQHVRVAAVAAGKLSLALAALSDEEMRAAGLGLMPFPGLDHGNGLLLALRRRLALLRTYGPSASQGTDVYRRVPGSGGSAGMVALPERLGIESDEALDRALALLVGLVLESAATEQQQAIAALAGTSGARYLRAILLPSAAYGASRLLTDWAHRRGLRVGALQHGIYSFREFDGGDRHADVIFGWGAGTVEQVVSWPAPQPRVHAVGVPGLSSAESLVRPSTASSADGLRRVLVATSSSVDAPLVPVSFCETFLDTLAAGLRGLSAAGVQIVLRPHPGEEPERYRRLLRARGMDVSVASEGSLHEALASADLLISSASSVAFEAAALGLPVLLWLGAAPRWVREKHLVAPWTESAPGMFEGAEDFSSLIDELLQRPEQGLRVARQLGGRLARYAQPFDRAAFAAALRELGS
jgi:hypothetical protein